MAYPTPSAYLNTGATDLSNANWSDGNGFNNGGATVMLSINTGTQSIQSGLSPSVATGINYLDISGFQGDIGGSGGSLAIETLLSSYDATTQLPRIKYASPSGNLWFTGAGAGGATDACGYFLQIGGGFSHLTGTFNTRRFECDSGTSQINQNVGSESTSYTWTIGGGNVTIDYSTTVLHNLTICGNAVVQLKRGVSGTQAYGAYTYGGLMVLGGTVVIDAAAQTYSNIFQSGGTVRLINSGTITEYTLIGGVLDASQVARPVTISLLKHGGAGTYLSNPNITITAKNAIGAGAKGVT